MAGWQAAHDIITRTENLLWRCPTTTTDRAVVGPELLQGPLSLLARHPHPSLVKPQCLVCIETESAHIARRSVALAKDWKAKELVGQTNKL